MKVTKTLQNLDILTYALAIQKFESENIVLPVKVSFYFSKNKKSIYELGMDLERQRKDIFEKNNIFIEEAGESKVSKADIEKANNQIKELFDLKQDVEIYLIPLEYFEGVNLSTEQFNAIDFMIKDEEEEEE